LIDRQRHSIILDVRSFRTADYDNNHYLVMAKVRQRLADNKQRSHRFHMERSNFKKLNEVEGKERYRAEVSNRFATLDSLDAEVQINRAWEMISHVRWVPDTTAWHFLRLWIEERPPAMEGSCKCIQ
jgi:hypothetical protein